MAMSLEDLLSKEGFKRRKSKSKLEGTSMPLYLQQHRHELASSAATKRAERTRSDVTRYQPKGEFSTSSSFTGEIPEKRSTARGANKRLSIGSEITEVGMIRSYKDVYSNRVYNDEREKDVAVDRANSSFKQPRKSNLGEGRSKKQDKLDEVVDAPAPALDEAAVKAVVSILSAHAARFVEDEDFRTSLHHSCAIALRKGMNVESCRVVESIEQGIEIVERAVEEHATLKELKKASLQLSVITGLNSDDLKDGFTSGIPNARLSACAHLYLGMIYALQKKDGIAAKHLLQVLCNSPFEARTALLPELWERLFLPHLLHLKVWFEQESRSLADSTNLKVLYNQSLDLGTSRFAMYYKDWITGGAEAPSVPVIKIPCFLMPRQMVSKVLYDQVFRHSHKDRVEFDSGGATSANSPAPVDKQLILYNNSVTQTNKTTPSPSSQDSGNDAAQRLSPHPDRVALMQETTMESPALQKNEYLSSIPEDFICPLTGLLFRDPVTLETGETFEREAITDWFGEGRISCPVSGKALKCETVPPTNLILKRVIEKWKTDQIERLLLSVGPDEALSSEDDRVARVMSFGGVVELLARRFPSADAQEKARLMQLLCCCVEADAGCRNDIAENMNVSDLLRLLRNGQLRSNAVLLLTELICCNRRSRARSLLESLLDEDITNAMDHLNMHLHSCPLEETPLVAVLILHLDLLSERESSSTHREEAVDSLTSALRRSLSNEKLEKKCCRALLILGGFFSPSGNLMTEDWILRLAGYHSSPAPAAEGEDEGEDEEETARDKWLVNLSASLGKKPFVEAVSKCVGLGRSDLVTACLTTAAWLSSSLGDATAQLTALSALVAPLIQCLQYGDEVEHKILASLSLLNFTAIPECRVLLVEMGDEVGPCLRDLSEVTWTARDLHNVILR